MSGSFKFNMDGLKKLSQAFGSNKVVRVGIFGNKNARAVAGENMTKKGTRTLSGTTDIHTNAELGEKHEFGSFSEGIPPRSWLRAPLHVKSGDIVAKASIGVERRLAAGNMDEILKILGKSCEAAIQEGFETSGFGSWRPNSPQTIHEKGSSMPLIDTGQLRRAVSSQVVSKDAS